MDAFMKRCVLIVFALVLLPLTLLAQETGGLPRVVVLPVVNNTGESRNDALAQTTTDTVALTIRLLEGYELVPFDGFEGEELSAPPVERAALVAERVSVESVLFGDVSRGEEGEFVFELDVYDRRTREVTGRTESVAESLFDVFDAADRLVAEAVGAFSGVRIGFGSLRFVPEGEFDYRVYLDGNVVGDNVATIERILIGERALRVTQLIQGVERRIYQEEFTVEEGESRVVSLVVPEATPEEEARAAELIARIRGILDRGVNLAPADPLLGELEELLTLVPAAVAEPEATLTHLRRRRELLSPIERLPGVNFGAAAAESTEAGIELVERVTEPVAAAFESAVEAGVSEERLEELRWDAARSGRAVSGLIVLARAGTPQEEAELVTRYNEMLEANHRLLRLSEITTVPDPYNRITQRAGAYIDQYDRAVERRRPWWHWAAGVVGAAGAGAAAYMQFVEIPGSESNRDSAFEEYEAARSVEAASAARDEVESEQQSLDFAYLTRNVGLGVSALLPVAVLARTVSSGRPRRAWREYEESGFRSSLRAAALDYRERRWEEGESALLILGDGEAVSGTGLQGTETTPVYLPVEPGQELSFTRETSGLDEAEVYRFAATPGLTILQLGGER